MRRIRGRLAGDRNSSELDIFDTRDPKPGSCKLNLVPVNAAVVFEYPKQWITGHQVCSHTGGAINLKPVALAQHAETERMVKLAVDQDHCNYAGISRLTAGLQLGQYLQL